MSQLTQNFSIPGGLCACLERKLGRKLHMVGCFLHMNELPLRHLITKLDGKTLSGNKFSGPIGQQLSAEDLHQRRPVNFERVPTNIERPPQQILEDLSNDQRILLEYMLAVSSGEIPENFVNRKAGPVSHARWLTTATRILMLYTRTVEPSPVLKQLVMYIQRVYGKVWFQVKQENTFTKGPTILFEIIQEVKAIDKDGSLCEIVFPIIERNAFACLGENFLASLLYSDQEHHRSRAVQKILSIRAETHQGAVLGGRIPKLNFDAIEWGDLIDIVPIVCCEPPCVRKFSDQEVEDMILFPGVPPPVPLHTQTVERAVKLTSEASRSSYTWEKRHENIVAKSASRKKRKRFGSKKDYVY